MAEQLDIAAKKLGRLAMPDSCDRCFWMQTHFKGQMPYAPFPSIFTPIDLYTKTGLHTWIDQEGSQPKWLEPLGDIVGYIEPPHHSKFRHQINDNVFLRGGADAIFKRRDGKLVIADYKTAAFKGQNDPLMSVYRVQLNCYALLAQRLKLGDVADLFLLYMEPLTSAADARLTSNRRDDGFAMGFRCQPLKIPIDTAEVEDLCETAWRVYSKASAPPSREGCTECAAVKQLLALDSKIISSRAVFATCFGAL